MKVVSKVGTPRWRGSEDSSRGAVSRVGWRKVRAVVRRKSPGHRVPGCCSCLGLTVAQFQV